MIITFFGHRSLSDTEKIKKDVMNALTSCNPTDGQITFYCGGHGDFDELCAEVCREFKQTHKECKLYLVMPYITESTQARDAEIAVQGGYDGLIYPISKKLPYHFAIIKRNEWMAHEADFVIAYVAHQLGGASKAVAYARKLGKTVFNLAE